MTVDLTGEPTTGGWYAGFSTLELTLNGIFSLVYV